MKLPDDNLQLQSLLPHQHKALCYVKEIASRKRLHALDILKGIFHRAGVEEAALDEAMMGICTHAQVMLHFHPDRLCVKRLSVAQALLQEGCYRNQFETGLSTGSLTAFIGGERDLWEKELFGGAYHLPGVSVADRPRYGTLDLMHHPDGPAPRFGSCYFVLRKAISNRCSFTFSGNQSPMVFDQSGTLDVME